MGINFWKIDFLDFLKNDFLQKKISYFQKNIDRGGGIVDLDVLGVLKSMVWGGSHKNSIFFGGQNWHVKILGKKFMKSVCYKE